MLGLIAETPIHYGAETGGGAIDLPVAREAATHYPVIAGSAFKGALKDWFGEGSVYTGSEANAGQLIFSDIRLLLLPVRSLAGSYAWVTCPLLLERLQRDAQRAGKPAAAAFTIPAVASGQYHSANPESPPQLQLEERQFDKAAPANPQQLTGLVAALQSLIAHPNAKARIPMQLVVLSDADFAWFAEFALPVNAHNVLDENKTSTNLWYEETLAPDTVMYGLILPRPTLKPEDQREAMKAARKELTGRPHLQIGAGETTGLGWFSHNCTAQQQGA
ncbi:type III-B CRISPR module RAMP protein Cmr4 [Rhodoferax sp.]|uniref:type III-B CRISPR module RAMP protein Cmr4 n=1 Tax=Rhodoferax sp. TaxID=50421 RepID=UPI00260F925A|nr:type III-B CRISPR module RAMP protein Cmr4 [Rhodoferax sp.]MDD2919542.1 type III-B CRISPR module RAMP protein Cmr4 [Rhodoferax sp.]